MNEDIKLIDEMILLIKKRIGSSEYYKFEFQLILCLEIARYEIFTINKITDHTAGAISLLFTFRVFESYYRDYPEFYQRRLDLTIFNKYNEKFAENMENGPGFNDADWIKYFCSELKMLTLTNGPNIKITWWKPYLNRIRRKLGIGRMSA